MPANSGLFIRYESLWRLVFVPIFPKFSEIYGQLLENSRFLEPTSGDRRIIH